LKKYLEKVDSYFGSVENSPFSYFSMKKREKIKKSVTEKREENNGASFLNELRLDDICTKNR